MHLALCPTFNATGKKDVTGAFLPEMRAWAKLREARTLQFNNIRSQKERRREVLEWLKYQDQLNDGWVETFAIFCHGWKTGLQCGFDLRTVGELVDVLAPMSSGRVKVILYACSAARDADADQDDDVKAGPGGAGGFASLLAQELWASGLPEAEVYAHATKGHTTRNPWLRVWRPDNDPANGDWVVEPRSALWRSWGMWLRSNTDFRLNFPFMSPDELGAKLVTRP